MNDQLKSVYDLPDVSFIDDDSIDAMMRRLVANFETEYKARTGKAVSLSAADPMRILLYALALDLYQLEQYVDRAGKQDLLKYSYGTFLDNLAANKGVTRKQPAAARTTIRFTFSEPQAYVLTIPQGTRVTNGNGVYFKIEEYTEAAAGAEYVDAEAVCTVEGIQGNGFLAGQINILVDPLPYVDSVSNITTSAGGQALESDSSLAERVYLAPTGYSVAGPADAYSYWAKTYNTNIGSVKPTSPTAGTVVIYILMADGSLPEPEDITGLTNFLASESIRPMTDLVTVSAPSPEAFNVSVTYYINQSDASAAETIQAEVEKAIADYITWQTSQIGRDINPDELVRRVKAAGAKRITVSAPAFTVVADTAVARLGTKTVNYGGLEDD